LIACIGPSTAEETAEQGLTVDIVPEEYTIDGLIAAVAAYFEDNTER
jgi:uroporphyrinogen-III synthase